MAVTRAVAAAVVGTALAACSTEAPQSAATRRTPTATVTPSVPDPPASSAAATPAPPSTRAPTVDDRRAVPKRARLTIAAIGVRNLLVVPYRGRTDDAAGTRIQDGGVAASPHGPEGGTGPGGIGNYQVTAHRLSSTQAFLRLPELRRGAVVVVEAGGEELRYRIVGTRTTSFRSPKSLRAQRAAVPGHSRETATRAMITLSTCATPEDHAAGNWWADEFGNPEHRIDKIGVLVG